MSRQVINTFFLALSYAALVKLLSYECKTQKKYLSFSINIFILSRPVEKANLNSVVTAANYLLTILFKYSFNKG